MKKILFLTYIFSMFLFSNAQILFAEEQTSAKGPGYAAVRGVWVTNVDSDFLHSREKIREGVKLCDSAGINTIFVVVWNKGMTLYKSRVMNNMFGEEIDPSLAGRDPLQEVVEEAHQYGIKVIPWFEFGLSSSYKLEGGRLLKLKPHWAARDREGHLLQKNGFEWMNGLHPEVQAFMLSLIMEVVKNYDVDGIQGDDRLPAMPVEGGYDDYSVSLYKKEHSGSVPPQDFRDTAWVTWRCSKLNSFMKTIYDSVKSYNPQLIVSMAPSPYPWGKEEYLQDWPAWLKDRTVEMLCPQLYRYDVEAYVKMLDEAVGSQLKEDEKKLFFPGILLKLGNYYPTEEYLRRVIEENRKRGVEGEVYFFFEGIKKFIPFFREQYKVSNQQ